ncbi:MAG TPA: prepilin peptidase, partial [Pseudodesulfovibrio sp.]|nr:prepilin peptidase [Pseudodesulfovibrio sp.]
IGAWLGVEATLVAFLFTCIAGGLYALVVLAFNPHMFKTVLRNIAYTFLVFIGTRHFNFASADGQQTLPRLCYGVAITVGTIGAMGIFAWESGSIFPGY